MFVNFTRKIAARRNILHATILASVALGSMALSSTAQAQPRHRERR